MRAMLLARDAIVAFTKSQVGAICAACMTTALHIPFDRVMDGWADILRRGDLPIGSGACSVCRARADVISSPVSNGRPGGHEVER
jgi:hypothetical protein